MILVTGATGHLGIVLIKKLIQKGLKDLRALVLPDDDSKILDEFDVEIIKGDICELDTIMPAFEDVKIVYHLAGKVSIKDFDPSLKKINIEGTENVIKVCKENNINRLLYVSSVHVFEADNLIKIKEDCPILIEKLRGEYSKTKAAATLKVIDAAKKGLDAVIVYPSGIIGPYDYRISPMSKMIIDHLTGRLLCLVEGSYDFVDVRDVAEGIINAVYRGKKGEGYILSGENISIEDLFKIIDGYKKPHFKSFNLPLWLAKIGIPFSHYYNKIIGCENLLTRYALYTLNVNTKFSNKKAKSNLYFKTRPIKETVLDTIDWLKSQGLI